MNEPDWTPVGTTDDGATVYTRPATEAELAPTPEPAFVMEPNDFQRVILFALPRTRKHVYSGTVPAATTAKRRAANRAARKTRQAQRRAA